MAHDFDWADKAFNKKFGEGSDPATFEDFTPRGIEQFGKPKADKDWTNGAHQHSHGHCYETHPALPLGEYKIYGGSCTSPMVKDADIYIGFDYGMTGGEHYPWTPPPAPGTPLRLKFEIPDMGVPRNAESFKGMVAWVADQLRAGKKVHCGCIGGHGRTGMFFAALVAHMGVSQDAIAYTRVNYCDRAVESHEQVEFLGKHFGIPPQKGYKEYTQGKSPTFTSHPKKGTKGHKGGKKTLSTHIDTASISTFAPADSALCLFGRKFT